MKTYKIIQLIFGVITASISCVIIYAFMHNEIRLAMTAGVAIVHTGFATFFKP